MTHLVLPLLLAASAPDLTDGPVPVDPATLTYAAARKLAGRRVTLPAPAAPPDDTVAGLDVYDLANPDADALWVLVAAEGVRLPARRVAARVEAGVSGGRRVVRFRAE